MQRPVATVLIAIAVSSVAAGCSKVRQEAAPSAAPGRSREEALFVYVKIPAPIMPIERGKRFEDPLDAALRKADVGEVTGGGSELTAPDAQGRQGIEYCGIDVDLYDASKGIPFLRAELARLAVPPGTVLEYTLAGKKNEVKVYAE
jgi:hypothetical protein